MALKNILVQLDPSPRSPERFNLALALAQKHQATLTGFFSTASTYFAQGFDKQKSQEIKGLCGAKATAADVQFIWHETEPGQENEPLVKRIAWQAYFADLSQLGELVEEKQIDKKQVSETLNEMEITFNNINGRVNQFQENIRMSV